jgi:hypothetical protein
MSAIPDTDIKELLIKLEQNIQEIKISQVRSEEKLVKTSFRVIIIV